MLAVWFIISASLQISFATWNNHPYIYLYIKIFKLKSWKWAKCKNKITSLAREFPILWLSLKCNPWNMFIYLVNWIHFSIQLCWWIWSTFQPLHKQIMVTFWNFLTNFNYNFILLPCLEEYSTLSLVRVQYVMQHIMGGGTLQKLHVSHFSTMIMVNVSSVLCGFIDCFLEQVFQNRGVIFPDFSGFPDFLSCLRIFFFWLLLRWRR